MAQGLAMVAAGEVIKGALKGGAIQQGLQTGAGTNVQEFIGNQVPTYAASAGADWGNTGDGFFNDLMKTALPANEDNAGAGGGLAGSGVAAGGLFGSLIQEGARNPRPANTPPDMEGTADAIGQMQPTPTMVEQGTLMRPTMDPYQQLMMLLQR